MNEIAIRDILVKRGEELFHSPKNRVEFTEDLEANIFSNELVNYPYAFVLGCLMDQQIKAERAWLIPYRISQKLGEFSIEKLAQLSENDIQKLMRKPEPLHRFVARMSNFFYLAVQRIKNQYDLDASRIWSDKPSSAEVVFRFLEFKGIGPKIASMASNILARELKIPFSDYYSIDISADVHVKRVFIRLGLCGTGANGEQVIYKARALYPQFPGIMDFACFEMRRQYCKARKAECYKCYMNNLCSTALNKEITGGQHQ